MIANIQIENKVSRPRFFMKIYLVAGTKFEIILGMLFLKLSNAKCHVVKEYLCREPLISIKSYLLLSKSRLLIKKLYYSSV